jgi:hypothetical protein
MGEKASEAQDENGGMLEEIMQRCTPEATVVLETTPDADYAAYMRRGTVRGVKLRPGVLRRCIDRAIMSMDQRAVVATAEMAAGRDGENNHHLSCIAACDYERGRTYDIPDGATLMRRGGKKVRFYRGQPSPTKNSSRRKFVAIPADAARVTYEKDSYKWVYREKG